MCRLFSPFFLSLLFYIGLYAQEHVYRPLFPCSSKLEDAYGICAHISRPISDYHLRKLDLNKMAEVGINWVRTDFDHYLINSANGKYKWNILDSTVVDTKNQGCQLLAILDRKINGKSCWEDTINYNKYIKALVNRYSDQIGYWEFVNEPDLIKGQGDIRDDYYTILKTSSRLIKSINSNTKIVLGGLASLSEQWLDKLSEHNAGAYADVFNYHSYALPETNIEFCERLSDHMQRKAWRMPVWVTELGMHTSIDTMTNKSFYLDIVPQALEKLGIEMKSSNAAIIADERYQVLCDDEIELYCNGFGGVSKVKLSTIASLDVSKYPVLFASSQECFPMEYFEALVKYVKHGGTIISSFGLPFYYDLKEDGSKVQINTRDYKKLHLSAMPWWSEEASRSKAPKVPSSIICADGFLSSEYVRLSDKCTTRYLSDKNLKGNDSIIPIVVAGDNNYMGYLAAIYKLDSDLKGNIIISTRTDLHNYIDREKEQARRLARNYIISFAMGVDKVFWYNLRAREKNKYYKEDNFGILHADLSPKYAFFAYETLTDMLPNGSSRPALERIGDIYLSSWTKPDGSETCAIWTVGNDKDIDMFDNGISEVYDYRGKAIDVSNNKLVITGGVSFIGIGEDKLRNIIKENIKK